MMIRRTKIIATLGPATDGMDNLRQMIQAGVNLVRVNFSHGSFEEHRDRIKAVRACAAMLKQQVGILVDLQGPKIRITKFIDGHVELEAGNVFVIDVELPAANGTAEHVGTDYSKLVQDVSRGDMLLLDDGRIMLQVEEISGSKVYTRVTVGGKLSNNKGINLKGGGLSAGALTQKDRKDLQYAAQLNVDYVAVSFVRTSDDIKEAKALLQEAGSSAGVIAKIERIEALNDIDKIISESSGVMVARGDLAVEIGDAEVPAIQKQIIRLGRAMNKPVITATQMMESMISNPLPTKAEVSDVANAVLDGTDAVMLSAETAVGKHPATVIEAVVRVCLAVEKQPVTRTSRHRIDYQFERVDEVIAMAAMYAANHMAIKAVAAISASGTTPLWMSRIRTGIPIYGLSRHTESLGKMTLYRNVYPIYFDLDQIEPQHIIAETIKKLHHRKLIQAGDLVIVTRGDLAGVHGGTNSLKIVSV